MASRSFISDIDLSEIFLSGLFIVYYVNRRIHMNYEKLDLLSIKKILKLIDIYEKQNVPDDYYLSFVENVLNQKGELRITANIVSNL